MIQKDLFNVYKGKNKQIVFYILMFPFSFTGTIGRRVMTKCNYSLKSLGMFKNENDYLLQKCFQDHKLKSLKLNCETRFHVYRLFATR